MKLDVLYEIDVPRPWGYKPHPYGQRDAEQQAYAEAFEQIKLADRMGFHTTWHVEHHFREGRSHSPSSEVILGALSQSTEQIRLGFGVTLMPHPFIHPARVAEKVATVDVLSKGRVEWGTGRSTPMEQTAFGVDAARSKDQWRAAVQTVVGMWESEYYEEHSEFLDFPRRMITPKPVQDPHPPAWMAGVSPGNGGRGRPAGSPGLLAMSDHEPARSTRRRPSASTEKRPPTPFRSPGCAPTRWPPTPWCIAPTPLPPPRTTGIWDSVWWWYHHLAEFTLEWEFPHFSQEEKDRVFPLLTARANGEFDVAKFDDADMIIVGDPERCYEKMCHYADIGVDELICYVQFGHLPHTSVMRTIELLGKEVIPALDRYVPKR